MKRIALFGLAAAAMPLASVASDSVWKDALVRMEGASDLNQNGEFDASTTGTRATSEFVDLRHGASTEVLTSQKTTRYGVTTRSKIRIVSNDVFSVTQNRTLPGVPCIHFDQTSYTDGGTFKVDLNRLQLFNNTSPITGDYYTAVFRLRPESYVNDQPTTADSRMWFFSNDSTGGALRLGLRCTDSKFEAGMLNFCFSGVSNDSVNYGVISNGVWTEISYAVSGQTIRVSWTAPGQMRRWAERTISFSPKPKLINLGGCRNDSGATGNLDGFRGDIQMFGLWNRTLSDAEVVAAFNENGNSIFKIGEEGFTGEAYGGASASGTVTLDPKTIDRRDWPASFGNGAKISIPFTVDQYRADRMQALRIMPRKGTSSAFFRVAIDGKDVGGIDIPACAQDAVPTARFLRLKAKVMTLGDHVLTLACETAGAVLLDAIEVGGAWQIGDGTGNQLSYDSDTAWVPSNATRVWADTYNASSLNYKDCAWYLGGTASIPRDKVVKWIVPSGLPEHATYRVRYKMKNGDGAKRSDGTKASPIGRDLLFKVNGETVYTLKVMLGSFQDSFVIPAGKLRDGLNDLRFSFDPLEAYSIWMNPCDVRIEMDECKSDWRSGLMLLFR